MAKKRTAKRMTKLQRMMRPSRASMLPKGAFISERYSRRGGRVTTETRYKK